MRPCLERSGFVHSGYDEAEVVSDGFLFRLQYTYASFLVVAPRGEKFGGNMVIRVACYFADKGLLSCCDLFFYVGSFTIRCSFTSSILMPSMRRILQCRNTSNF